MRKDPNYGSPHLNVEREKPEESLYLPDPEEPVELVEIYLDEPPTKRRSVWCQDILQEEEKHGAPIGTSRE